MEEKAAQDKRAPTQQEKLDALWPTPIECDDCWLKDGQSNEEFAFMYLEQQYGTQESAASGIHHEL